MSKDFKLQNHIVEAVYKEIGIIPIVIEQDSFIHQRYDQRETVQSSLHLCQAFARIFVQLLAVVACGYSAGVKKY